MSSVPRNGNLKFQVNGPYLTHFPSDAEIPNLNTQTPKQREVATEPKRQRLWIRLIYEISNPPVFSFKLHPFRLGAAQGSGSRVSIKVIRDGKILLRVLSRRIVCIILHMQEGEYVPIHKSSDCMTPVALPHFLLLHPRSALMGAVCQWADHGGIGEGAVAADWEGTESVPLIGGQGRMANV
jgi:hypothetical protein